MACLKFPLSPFAPLHSAVPATSESFQMKNFILAALAAFALTACANPALLPLPIPLTPLTPAQLIAQIDAQCVIVKSALVLAPTMPGVSAGVLASLPNITGSVNTVCAATATLNAASLQTLVDTALPAILTIVEAVPNPDPNVRAAITGIQLAQILLPGLIAQAKAIVPVIVVPAVPVA
jgi:hypothetical protein